MWPLPNFSVIEGVITYSVNLKTEEICFNLKQCNILHIIYLNCLVSIDFVKYIPKSLFPGFSSFQAAHNLLGQKRPLLSLCFNSPQIDFIIATPPVVFRVHRRLFSFLGRKQGAARLQGTIAERFLFQFSPHSNFNLYGATVKKLFA